ncbi:MAG: sensor histidine kinase, partial [Bacteroidota bacterium]
QSKGHLAADDRVISLAVTGTPHPVQGDVTLLTHAINNLVTNALKYSPDKQAPEVTLNFQADKVELKIRDFGIGIPQSEQSKLFQTFYRATNATNIQGTGMGLVIVKQFIEMHGGTVALESEENRGTCVTVVLPGSNN